MPMIVRSARGRDLSIIATIQAGSWRDSYSEVLPRDYLAGRIDLDLIRHWREAMILPGDVVLVAENEEENQEVNPEVIGFIAVWCRPDPFIDNLHVKPNWRSRQVGSTLMKEAARQLYQAGHRTAHLWAVESNERAIRFYERLGGVCGEVELKDIFGHNAPNVRVTWSDLSRIWTSG